jgi:hypothetical protein
MVHWLSYLYIYPSWTDILVYYTDRITDVTLTQAALQHAPALLRPFDGPHRGALQQMWHDVQICAPGLWGPDLKPLPDPLSDHTLM